MLDSFNFAEIIRNAVAQAFKELSSATVLVTGRTGVGKSTLINSVFAGKMATTGQGRPVTTAAREYTKEGVAVRIIDTVGLETAAYQQTREALEKLLDERQRDRDPSHHIHVAWLCISEDSRRIEQSDIELHEILSKRNIPVIAVVTKSRKDKDGDGKSFRSVVQQLLPLATAVVRVRAEREEDDDGHTRPAMGLPDLISATMEVVPEGHRRALIAAQKVAIDEKARHARGVMATAATAAAAAAATPVPFADAALIVPIQVAMLAGISATFGLPVTEAMLMTLITSTVGAGGAAIVGRTLAASFIKMIPGAGSIVGGVINAATASALTVTLGELYIATLVALFEKHAGEPPTEQDVKEEFRRRLRA
jgi:uncharacterized protein (DUF697 family)/GTP-binding protein EngB required for normal cell division